MSTLIGKSTISFSGYILLPLLLAGAADQVMPQSITPSPADFLSVREIDGDVQLSPSGSLVAAVIYEPGDSLGRHPTSSSNIWLIPTSGIAPGMHRLVGSAGTDDTPRWSPDGTELAFLSARPIDGRAPPGEQLYVASVAGGSLRRLTNLSSGIDRFAWSPDGRTIAFIARGPTTAPGHSATGPQPAVVYTVAAGGGAPRVTFAGQGDVEELAWAPSGKQLALLVTPGPTGASAAAWTLEVVDPSAGRLVRELSRNAAPIGGTLRWSPDGIWIAFLQNSPTKLGSWLAVASAAWGVSIGVLQDDTGTVWHAEWTRVKDRLMVEEVRGTSAVLRTVDVHTNEGRVWTSVDISQDNYGFSTDGHSVAYISETNRTPADLWFIHEGDAPVRLTTLNPQVDSWQLGTVDTMSWRSSRDGSMVRGVVVFPPGFEPGHRYPTVVETHPGDEPWWTGWLANWWAWGQLLATHGYVVFLPNYRGVTGQGWRAHEHLGEWGGLSYQDLIDGVDALVRRPFVDSTRLGIGGWSNGGFVTAWAITHTTRFRAAVAKSAHTDFVRLYATSPSNRPYLLLDFGGEPDARDSVYVAHSPLTFVRACRTPTLLVYGEHDIVSPSQGTEFHAALQQQGVPSELVVYRGEEHGLDSYRDRLDFDRRVLAWFDRYLR